MKNTFLSLLLVIVVVESSLAAEAIRIMPVGDSITAGEHYRFPALAERTGYRKALFEMLIRSGYNVDFVGSQNHGIRPTTADNWYDWNCEAYPGWKIPNIAKKVEAALSSTNEADILLVHVGTNGTDWANKPGQVTAMLNMINNYSVVHNHPMTVFLCLIINRFIDENPAPTTQFNKDVARSVAARSGDKIKIILVDMEKGAGLDYSDASPNPHANPPYEGGDMWGHTYPGFSYDMCHPNDRGNAKMAAKFFEALVKELNPNANYGGNGTPKLGGDHAATNSTNQSLLPADSGRDQAVRRGRD